MLINIIHSRLFMTVFNGELIRGGIRDMSGLSDKSVGKIFQNLKGVESVERSLLNLNKAIARNKTADREFLSIFEAGLERGEGIVPVGIENELYHLACGEDSVLMTLLSESAKATKAGENIPRLDDILKTYPYKKFRSVKELDGAGDIGLEELLNIMIECFVVIMAATYVDDYVELISDNDFYDQFLGYVDDFSNVDEFDSRRDWLVRMKNAYKDNKSINDEEFYRRMNPAVDVESNKKLFDRCKRDPDGITYKTLLKMMDMIVKDFEESTADIFFKNYIVRTLVFLFYQSIYDSLKNTVEVNKVNFDFSQLEADFLRWVDILKSGKGKPA